MLFFPVRAVGVIRGYVRFFLLLTLSAQALGAGLGSYPDLLVSDSLRTEQNGIRVTYLGTNGYHFEFKGHALLVDPYFSRTDLLSVALGSRMTAVKQLNEELAAKGRAAIQIGIGIHCGPAIVGSIGSPERLEFTAIGNTVNIASRLEGLTKSIGRSLLVTAAVRESAGDSFIFEELPPQEVRGIEGRVSVFAVG